MERNNLGHEEITVKCALCKQEVALSNIYCINCGYPQNGSKEQKDLFKKEREKTKAVLRTAKNKIKGAAAVLGGVGAVTLIFSLAIAGGMENYIEMIAGCGAGLIFITLSIWSGFKPYPALLIGTILYSLLLIFDIVTTLVSSGFPGFPGLLKILILVVLITGLTGARKAAELEDQLKK